MNGAVCEQGSHASQLTALTVGELMNNNIFRAVYQLGQTLESFVVHLHYIIAFVPGNCRREWGFIFVGAGKILFPLIGWIHWSPLFITVMS